MLSVTLPVLASQACTTPSSSDMGICHHCGLDTDTETQPYHVSTSKFSLRSCKKWVFSGVPQYRMRKRIRTVPLGFKKVYFYFFLNVKDIFVRHQRREDQVSKSRAEVPCASQNPQNANGTRCQGARTETEKPMCLAISAHFQPTSPSRLPTQATTDLGQSSSHLGNHVTGTSDLAIPSMQRAGTTKTKGGDSRTVHLDVNTMMKSMTQSVGCAGLCL